MYTTVVKSSWDWGHVFSALVFDLRTTSRHVSPWRSLILWRNYARCHCRGTRIIVVLTAGVSVVVLTAGVSHHCCTYARCLCRGARIVIIPAVVIEIIERVLAAQRRTLNGWRLCRGGRGWLLWLLPRWRLIPARWRGNAWLLLLHRLLPRGSQWLHRSSLILRVGCSGGLAPWWAIIYHWLRGWRGRKIWFRHRCDLKMWNTRVSKRRYWKSNLIPHLLNAAHVSTKLQQM